MVTSLLGPLAALLAVILLIPLALWLLRRTPVGQAAAAAGMRVVGSLALAPNQRVVTLEVGRGDERRWLVLGVTPGGIQTLHTLSPQGPAPADGVANGLAGLPFARLLARHKAESSAVDGTDHAR